MHACKKNVEPWRHILKFGKRFTRPKCYNQVTEISASDT